MPDADLDLAAEGALFSGFGTAGQRCTSLGTVIVHESVHDEFMRRFTRPGRGRRDRRPLRGRALRPDDPRALPRALRGLARADPRPPHGVGLDRHRADHRRQPARRGSSATPTPGIFCHPTIVDGVTADDEIYSTETFGPIVGVASFGDFDEAIELANGHGYGLSAAIYTNDAEVGLPLPRARDRRDGLGQQLDLAAPRPTCRSAATASRATARASRASGCSTSSRAGSRMNWDYAGKLQKAQMDVAELTGDSGYRLAWD